MTLLDVLFDDGDCERDPQVRAHAYCGVCVSIIGAQLTLNKSIVSLSKHFSGGPFSGIEKVG